MVSEELGKKALEATVFAGRRAAGAGGGDEHNSTLGGDSGESGH